MILEPSQDIPVQPLHGMAVVGAFLAATLSGLLLHPGVSFKEADVRSENDRFMAQPPDLTPAGRARRIQGGREDAADGI